MRYAVFFCTINFSIINEQIIINMMKEAHYVRIDLAMEHQ